MCYSTFSANEISVFCAEADLSEDKHSKMEEV